MHVRTPRNRIKPRRPPNPDTWLGRHQAAMHFITGRFKGRTGRIMAWVIGVGGKPSESGSPQFVPTEHVEVAQALEKAGVRDFFLYAMEVSRQSIALVEEQLKTGSVKNARKGHLGIPLASRGVDVAVPRKMAEKMTLLGPGDSGDIFLVQPAQRPDVVTVFNVARSYHWRHQGQLGRTLAAALLEGGILLTNRTESQTVFIRALEERLGAPLDLGPYPDLGKPGRVVAFAKKA